MQILTEYKVTNCKDLYLYLIYFSFCNILQKTNFIILFIYAYYRVYCT